MNRRLKRQLEHQMVEFEIDRRKLSKILGFDYVYFSNVWRGVYPVSRKMLKAINKWIIYTEYEFKEDWSIQEANS